MRATDDWTVRSTTQLQPLLEDDDYQDGGAREALEQDGLDGLIGGISELRVEAPRAVFYEGDPCESLYRLTDGNVMLSKMLFDGRRQVMEFLTAGDIFGFSAGDAYTYSVEPLGVATVRQYKKRQLAEWCLARPGLEARLLHIAARELAAAQEHMLLLGRKTAVERVASFLLMLSSRAARRAETDNPVILPMTRAQIGDYLGITLETVSRAMSSMARSGVIEIQQSNTVLLRDEHILQQIAEGDGSARMLIGAY